MSLASHSALAHDPCIELPFLPPWSFVYFLTSISSTTTLSWVSALVYVMAGMSETSPIISGIWILSPSWKHYLGGWRGVALMKEVSYLGPALRVKRLVSFLILSLFHAWDSRCELSVFCSGCHAFIWPSHAAAGPKQPSFNKLPWSWCFITAREN